MADPEVSTVRMPMPEQIIAGRYRIISRLGSGGMGLVFLAEQLGVGSKVALKFLDPEPSDETRAARFLREAKVALQVLAFAHERHIVHRDVKPENLRVRRDVGTPHVKVLDFGIARLLTPRERETI